MFHSRRVQRIFLTLSLSLTLAGCFDTVNGMNGALPTSPSNPSAGNNPLLAGNTVQQAIRPATGAVLEDLKDVSGEYELSFSSEQLQEQTIRFQLDAKSLPSQLALSDFQLERFDENSGNWIAEGILAGWDPNLKQVAFEVKNPLLENFSTALIKLVKYRIRVYLFSNAVTVKNPDSDFRITYYPSHYGYKASVKKDADWNGSGLNAEPDIPNYIEDLDKALNEAYQSLLELKDGSGNPLFKKLKTPIDLNVLDTGTDLGNSPLGGPATISAKSITSWQDMRQTVAHELVHVLQGQYYSLWGLFTGRANQWFIEASAQYFAARALNLNSAERSDFFSDGAKNIEHYLSVPILASDARSYYALGHFFDWATAQTRESLIPDILKTSSVRDSRALNSQLQATQAFNSLGDAIYQYGRFLVTHPEADAQFALATKNAMRSMARNFLDKPTTNLINQNIYLPFKRELPALASNYLAVYATELSGDNLLVIAAKEKNSEIETLAFANPATVSAEYQKKQAVDRNTSLYTENSLSVPHFGKDQPNKGFEIFLSNTSLTETAKADFELYFLRPPKILEIKEGSVKWDLSALADLPHEKIKGYSVYIGSTALKREIPLEEGKTEQAFSHQDIHPNSEVRVTMTDLLEHEWPEPIQEKLEIKLKNIAFNNFVSTPNPDTPEIITRSVGKDTGGSLSFDTEVVGTSNQAIQWQLARIGTGGTNSLSKATPVFDPGLSAIGSFEQTGNHVVFNAKPGLKGIQFFWIVGTALADPSVRFMFVVELWGDLQS
ncbi:hypothetical protein COW36_08410 [bacterium (Candidatus Blackallbacteria) CG17_big_fil_post_rev_8_21_14_2_50_48_46]|uniref:Peptidase MA-like domain-containing protein n=1 Tax=bacterium (Candidatus Blackallbacteria) CG17_big_fil_post_rev_8_21_14_2_50_48_46 TaxID=2014261 RepID=A0A2M7G684_9BACT|nr:MAG: hypothetical protein COW64_24950 [bacterium (Candidatus Blackallbacteria) CG18_big_fil_WC_8_21_14_2_50_49_26]PIW17512.1 MAG: hypothetical protein COW36_08410 [bacterium (Candidatus Blackallbacteria) CG17_big_fil_post_rev_8_21_14_2_50_48_46]PIW48366.1 MAG: hypothetical protein COW20_09765 [bacterium (Candidatus Blackallbacteria) CG13_big_fil_rev_8_21_14_2_50_49_14]